MSLRSLAFKCLAVLAMLTVFYPLHAAEEGIVPRETAIKVVPGAKGGIYFNGTFHIELSDETKDVLERGIPLNFILQVEVERKRWYWVNKDMGTVRENMRLSYNPLTRQYKVNIGSMMQNFDSVNQAVQSMSTISNLLISPYQAIDDKYVAKARFYLDTSRLPKPFQVTLRRGGGWHLNTGWFNVRIDTAKQG